MNNLKSTIKENLNKIFISLEYKNYKNEYKNQLKNNTKREKYLMMSRDY